MIIQIGLLLLRRKLVALLSKEVVNDGIKPTSIYSIECFMSETLHRQKPIKKMLFGQKIVCFFRFLETF